MSRAPDFVDGEPDRASARLAAGVEEACHHDLHLAIRLTVCKRHKHDFDNC